MRGASTKEKNGRREEYSDRLLNGPHKRDIQRKGDREEYFDTRLKDNLFSFFLRVFCFFFSFHREKNKIKGRI